MGDYFGHWLSLQAKTTPDKLPRIYYVNWFRKGADGTFLWPGFGENSRVLKWIFERTSGAENGVKTAIGVLPAPGALDLSGLKMNDDDIKTLLSVDASEWQQEAVQLGEYFKIFGNRLPKGISDEVSALQQRLKV
jgi:phosphoenolpyruvate carboxykinase (GTP)